MKKLCSQVSCPQNVSALEAIAEDGVSFKVKSWTFYTLTYPKPDLRALVNSLKFGCLSIKFRLCYLVIFVPGKLLYATKT